MQKTIRRAALPLLLVLLLLLPLWPTGVAATGKLDITVSDAISVFVDGKRLSFDVQPFIAEGRTMVPMAAILTALGASLTWDESTKTVTARRGDTEVLLVIDRPTAQVNGKSVELDIPARIINGRTFVPLRFISEAFEAEAGWDGSTRTITISRPAHVTKLTLTPAVLSLRSGQDCRVAVTALNDDGTQESVDGSEISWKSADPAVALAEGGAVKGTGPGNTVITAAYGGASAGLTVKVDETLSGIALSPAGLNLEIKDTGELSLMARYTDEDPQPLPADRAGWRSSNNNIVTVSEGRVTAVSVGTATITATFYNHQATAHVEVFRNMPVEFADMELRALIRNKLNKPEGTLYRSDLAALRELEAGDRLIEDLAGLEYCANLRSLALSGNHIRDISPLAKLIALERLELGYNQVSDLTPLAGLAGLGWLSINNNRISDLTPLADLGGLRWLSLAGNDIGDLSPLANLKNLKMLNVSNNRISNINALEEMKNLTTLSCWNNQVDNLSPLANLPKLTSINAWSNKINSISPLAGLPELSWLVIGDNPLDFSTDAATMMDIRLLRGRGVFVHTEAF